jgi:DNA end-binding protein Ku
VARAIWTGSLAFGLVNVPVAVYAATGDHTIHFHQFEAGTSDRIRYQRVNERTGEEVDPSRIVRGHEIGDGGYVLVTDEELEAVEPGRSRTIEITGFVELADIDPVFYQRTYYLAPQGPDAERAYALLRQAMEATGKAGIATFVMRGKEYLVTIRPEGKVLALETMFFADEVRDPEDELGGLPSGRAAPSRQLDIARQLIESMATGWRPEDYQDTYRERVADLIERKRRGEEIVTEREQPEQANVVDRMDALRRSAEAARSSGGRPGAARGRRAARGRAASGKRAAGGKRATSAGRASGERTRGRRRAVAARGAGEEAGLDRMSKAELAKLAAGLGISGRSRMGKDELAAAVREARGG